MRHWTRIALPLFAALLLVSCDANKISDDWIEQIDKSVNELNAQMDKVAMAVPGERWLRLVDAAGGAPDSAERKEAERFLKQLFDIDFGETYQVTAAFTFPTKGPDDVLDADVFWGSVASSDSVVKQYCEAKGTFNPKTVGSQIAGPRPPAEVEQAVRDTLWKAVHDAGLQVRDVRRTAIRGGNYGPGGHEATFGIQSPSVFDVSPAKSYPVDGRPMQHRAATEAELEQHARRRQVADLLAEAVLQVHRDRSLPITEAVINLPFAVGRNLPVLYVLVREEHFHKYNDSLKVTAAIHAAGDSADTLHGRWPVEWEAKHFRANEPQECGDTKDRIVWTSHNMSDSPSLSDRTVAAMRQLDSTLAEWQKISAGLQQNDRD